MKNNLYKQFLMISHKVYLPYNLSVCYKTSRLVGNMQTVETNSFMVIHSFFWSMYFDIFAKACNFWLTFSTIFKRPSLNVNWWSLGIPNSSSYLLLLSWFPTTWMCRTLPNVVLRWDFPLLFFKQLIWNHVKTIKVTFSSLPNSSCISGSQV